MNGIFHHEQCCLFDGEGNDVYIYKGPITLKKRKELKKIEEFK